MLVLYLYTIFMFAVHHIFICRTSYSQKVYCKGMLFFCYCWHKKCKKMLKRLKFSVFSAERSIFECFLVRFRRLKVFFDVFQ